jgi:hypothetical protein
MRGPITITVVTTVVSTVLADCAPPAPLGPQPTAQLGPRLSAPQIAAEMVGNTGTGSRTATNAPYQMYVAPDGTLASRIYDRTDSGVWRITGDGFFCATWRVDFDGKEVCHDVHKAGVAVQLHSPTALEVLTFVPGNRL